MDPDEITKDALLDGAVTLFQPKKGFRAGTDSVLLGAVLAGEGATGTALEFGCGPGGALFTAAHHLPGWSFVGIEKEGAAADLARRNVIENGMSDRIEIEHAQLPDAIGSLENTFDLVFSNPPYFEAGKLPDPGAGKAAAYIESVSLDDWLKGMLFAAKPRAPIVIIHRAAELARILARLDRQAGDIQVMPIRPYPGAPANRILVRARKGLRSGGMKLLAGVDIYSEKGGEHSARAKAAMTGLPLSWA